MYTFPHFKEGNGRRLRLRRSSRTVETSICKRSATCPIVRIGSDTAGRAVVGLVPLDCGFLDFESDIESSSWAHYALVMDDPTLIRWDVGL